MFLTCCCESLHLWGCCSLWPLLFEGGKFFASSLQLWYHSLCIMTSTATCLRELNFRVCRSCIKNVKVWVGPIQGWLWEEGLILFVSLCFHHSTLSLSFNPFTCEMKACWMDTCMDGWQPCRLYWAIGPDLFVRSETMWDTCHVNWSWDDVYLWCWLMRPGEEFFRHLPLSSEYSVSLKHVSFFVWALWLRGDSGSGGGVVSQFGLLHVPELKRMQTLTFKMAFCFQCFA